MTRPNQRRRMGEAGNIFTFLFGAVAVVGIITAATMQLISGPIRTASRVNAKNMAESQMIGGARILIIDAVTQVNDGDVDTDGFIEPREYTTQSGGITGGGSIPITVGASRTDPWGSLYGYCVWDAGPTDAGKNDAGSGSTNRLNGANTQTDTILAVVSAGPDKVFQTSCKAFDGAGGDDGVNSVAGSDDLIQKYSYAEAREASSELWAIKAGTPETANIGKTLEVYDPTNANAVTASINRSTGIGDFLGITTDVITAKTSLLYGINISSLRVQPQGGANEGAEIHLLGEGANAAMWMDNYAGNLRIHTNSVTAMTILQSGNVGVGTAGPTSVLHVQTAAAASAAGQTAINVGGIHAAGTVGSGPSIDFLDSNNGNAQTGRIRSYTTGPGAVGMAFETGYGAPGTRMLISNTGNVGIGTTGPTYKLTVSDGGSNRFGVRHDGVVMWGSSVDAPTNAGILTWDTGTVTMGAVSAATDTYIRSGGANQAMVIKSAGNVGIGTAGTPLAKLHVNGDISIYDETTARGNNYYTGTYGALGETRNGASTVLGNNVRVDKDANNSVERFASVPDPGNFIRMAYSRGITFHTNITSAVNTGISEDTNERMRINLDGTVGIGTPSPVSMMHLRSATGPTITLEREDTDLTTNELIGGTDFYINDANMSGPTVGSYIRSHVASPITSANMFTDLRFATAGNATATERMRIRYDGNVGIGTTNPLTKFHVLSGTQNATGVQPTALAVFETTNATNSAYSNVAIHTNTAAAADVGGTLGLGGLYRTGTLDAINFAVIRGAKENAANANYAGYLSFSTYTHGSTLAERMRITSTGNVGIGTPNPTLGRLEINNGAATALYATTAAAGGWGGNFHNTDSGGDRYALLAGGAYAGIFMNGNVGIGTITPGYTLEVSGNIHATGTVTSSDARLKKNIETLDGALDSLLRLRGVAYDWKKTPEGAHEGRQIGVIAQEVEKVFPELVFESDDGTKSVNYPALVAPLIEAVKELKAENDDLKARVERLENGGASNARMIYLVIAAALVGALAAAGVCAFALRRRAA